VAAAVVGGSAARWIGGSMVPEAGDPPIRRSADPLSFFAPDVGTPSEAASPRRKLLQVFDSFILLETPDGVAVIDQHSAHERIIFERTMATLSGGQAPAQRLLLPITIRLSTDELEAVDRHRETLLAVGFEVEPFGGDAVILHAVPNPHRRFDAARCFQEVAADLAGHRFGALANRLERFAATYACRAAVKAGEPLQSEELEELVSRLFTCTLPPHDVHGRPTIVQLPRTELERRFGRA
jgi:DNA mismatch repair protein MutL